MGDQFEMGWPTRPLYEDKKDKGAGDIIQWKTYCLTHG